MDDPLVGLTHWQSQEVQKIKQAQKLIQKSSSRTETQVVNGDSQLKEPPSNVVHPPLPSPSSSPLLHLSEGGGRLVSNSPHSSNDDCFPCLPSLENTNQQYQSTLDKSLKSTIPTNSYDSNNIDENRTKDQDGRHSSEENDSSADQSLQTSLINSPAPKLNNYWLLRLFESNLFTMHIAIQYLFKERDSEVQAYLGKKLLTFDNKDVDFYLPELVNMYIHIQSLFPVLHKYFLSRCRYDVVFSLKLAWLLAAAISDKWLPSEELQTASRMLSLIKTEQIRPPQPLSMSPPITYNCTVSTSSSGESSNSSTPTTPSSSTDKHHQRSLSASSHSHTVGISNGTVLEKQVSSSSVNITAVGNKLSIGDLRSGQAFDNNCICTVDSSSPSVSLSPSPPPSCNCSAPRLLAQDIFVRTLGHISKRLLKYSTRALRTNQLYAELSQLNLNFPARVCLPLYPPTHQVLRVPPSEAVVLNSKCKAPFLLFIEVAEVEDTFLSPLAHKQLDTLVTSSGLPPEEVKNFVHSEGPSPVGTRASSLPNLRCGVCVDSLSLCSLDNVPCSSIVEEKEEGGEGGRGEKGEGESTCSSSKDSNCEVEEEEDGSPVTFHVSEIRSRLKKEMEVPKKSFSRDPEDPSASAMKEPWEEKVKRIRERSPYGHLPNWKLIATIVKWGDDLRQEVVSWQLLEQFKRIWREENVPLWVRPYTVLVFSSEGGFVEPVCNAISLHQIKKEFKGTLLSYFKTEFGDVHSEQFLTAQRNFLESCAAYCLISYFIQVKDRHNGNILLDSTGHLIHIDFGFILAHSPGSNIRFESSPFKLTQEFVDVMGGVNSDMYRYFKILMLRGFLAARKHMEQIVNIIDIMQTGSQLPCFGHGPTTVKQLRDRFHLSLTEEQLDLLVSGMIDSSISSLTTKLYDSFQYLANGIL